MSRLPKDSDDLVEKVYLMGFMPLGEALSVLMGELGHNFSQTEVREMWTYRTHVANSLVKSDPYTITGKDIHKVISDLDPEMKPFVDGLAKTIQSYPYYKGVSYEFKQVDVEKIIALQAAINLGTVEQFKKQVSEKPTPQEVAKMCFGVYKTEPDVTYGRVGNNMFQFASDDEDVRVMGPEVRRLPKYPEWKEGEMVDAPALVFPVARGDPFLHAVRTSTEPKPRSGQEKQYQITLLNGFHRAYALRELGVKRLPCMLISSASPNETISLLSAWTTERQQQVTWPRPPLLKDFSDDQLTAKFKMRKKKIIWKISWQWERLST